MIVYYDGVCALCNRFVLWALRHDKRGALRFASLDSDHGEQLRRDFPALREIDSIIVSDGSIVATKSDAVIIIARRLHLSLLATALRLIPRALRDMSYDAIARRRYRWFGKYDVCPMPPSGMRDRFL